MILSLLVCLLPFIVAKLEGPLAGVEALRDLRSELLGRKEVGTC